MNSRRRPHFRESRNSTKLLMINSAPKMERMLEICEQEQSATVARKRTGEGPLTHQDEDADLVVHGQGAVVLSGCHHISGRAGRHHLGGLGGRGHLEGIDHRT